MQARSNTGFSIFGGRRRSIAITDDAYSAAIRVAKSHLDLSTLEDEAKMNKKAAAEAKASTLASRYITI